jgi:hypothetical protein
MVVLGIVLGKCEMPSTDISQKNDHAILIVKRQFVAYNLNSSESTLPFFLNLFYRNITGTYLIILSLFWRKIVNICDRNNDLKCTYLLQMDVFGQNLHFTPLFMADLVEILPSMQFSSNIMVSSTFQTSFNWVSSRS